MPEHLDDSQSSLPSRERCYLDLVAYGRDAELSGDIFTVEASDGQHVFWLSTIPLESRAPGRHS